ncbi:MAG: hypothetical protein V1898_00550 [Patescibacteria group bacterium]
MDQSHMKKDLLMIFALIASFILILALLIIYDSRSNKLESWAHSFYTSILQK